MQISVNNTSKLASLVSFLNLCGRGIGIVAKTIWQVYCYLVSFKWLVDFVRYLVKTAGYASESAFVLATLYVTINMLAHTFLLQFIDAKTLTNFDQLSVIAFAGLPELIVIAALTVTFHHWKLALRMRDKKHYDVWLWAIGFSLPTIIFVVMTIITLWQIKANSVFEPQTNDILLRIRCLSGWLYATLQMLFLTIGKPSYKEKFDTLQSDIDSKNATIKDRDTTISGLQNDLATLQNDMETLQQELMQARLQLAQRRIARMKSDVKDDMKPGENESMTFETEGVTMTATGNAAKMERLKNAIQAAIAKGGQFKMIDVAKEAKVSYGMARQHGPIIIKELTQELPAISKAATATGV